MPDYINSSAHNMKLFKRFNRTLIMSALLANCAVCTTALAVPARKAPITIKQPDGTELTIIIKGNEFFHYATTVDNIPIQRNANGIFCYQTIGNDGLPAVSDIKVSEVDSRTAVEKEYIKGLDIDRLYYSLDNKATSETRPQRVMSKIIGDTTYPTKGKQKGLVILVEFKDNSFTIPSPKDEYTKMLNEKGYSNYDATGSAFDYFYDASNGQFEPEFDVYGPLKLKNNMAYYGGNTNGQGTDKAVAEMIAEACQALDNEIDFKEYDRNNDGILDNVYVFYAGHGENDTYDPDAIWPQTWDIYNGAGIDLKLDGIRVQTYACSNELDMNKKMCGIGTFCHEFSHVLGLPDLYPTQSTQPAPFTPGPWTILDDGPYNNDGRTPPTYTAYERYTMKWLEPVELNKPLTVTLNALSTNQAYIIKTPKENEYFLLENRQQEGWDKYIPSHGMLIWHIDYNQYIWEQNAVSNTASHQYVDIEEADDNKTETSRDKDVFPGEWEITEFTDNTTPSMRTWKNEKLNKPIKNIREENGKIIFDFMGGGSAINETETDMISVFGGEGCIRIESAQTNVPVEIYDISGKLLNRLEKADEIPAEKGIYLVKIENKTYKVNVW